MGERLDYRAIEGVLYSLGRRPDSAPVRSSLSAARPLPGPRDPMRETAMRIDLTFSIARLPEAEATVLTEHYVRGRPQPGYARRRAIRMLRVVLDSAQGDG